MRFRKRLFALLMSLAIVMTYMPAIAFAEADETAPETGPPAESIEEGAADEAEGSAAEEIEETADQSAENTDGSAEEEPAEKVDGSEEEPAAVTEEPAAKGPQKAPVLGDTYDPAEAGEGEEEEEEGDTDDRVVTSISMTCSDGVPVIEEFTHGWYESDGNGGSYYYYDFLDSGNFVNGDVLSITYEGSDTPLDYVYYGYDVNIGEMVFAHEDNGTWDRIYSDKIQVDSDQSPDNPWGAGENGEDHEYVLTYKGATTTYPVRIVKNSVESFSFSRAGYDPETSPVVLAENTDGFWYEDEEPPFFCYSFELREGDVVAINGTDYIAEERTEQYGTVLYFVNSENSEDKISADDIYVITNEEQWDAGAHVIYIEYNGIRCPVNVIIAAADAPVHIAGKAPTCEEHGNIEYWEYAGLYYSDEECTQEIDNLDDLLIPALGHDWNDAEYTWADDYSEVTAWRTCKNDLLLEHMQTETVQTTCVTLIPATDTQDATLLYSAEFENEVFEAQSVTVVVPSEEHVHSLIPHPAQEAKCNETGNTAYWECTECGRLFADENAETEIAYEDTVIPETETHTWSYTGEVAWSGEDAYAVFTCDVCKTSYFQQMEVTTTREEPTCDTEGRVIYSASISAEDSYDGLAHSGSTEEYLPPVGHDWQEPVYYWSEDNSTVTAVIMCNRNLDHTITEETFTRAETIKEATATEEGEIVYTAEFMGIEFETQTKTVTVPAIGHEHQMTEHQALDPTCTEPGNTAYWTCDECGKYFSDADGTTEISAEDTVIDALGHFWGQEYITKEPTETEEGIMTSSCTRCGEIREEPIPVIAHVHSMEFVPRISETCTEDGMMQHWECSGCGKLFGDYDGTTEVSEEDLFIPRMGHDWREPTYTWDYSYTGATARRVCRNDSSHEENEYAEAVHSVTKEPACTEKGEETFTVSFENTAFEEQVYTQELPAVGHSMSEVEYKAATCTEDGAFGHWHCSLCGKDYFFMDGGDEITQEDIVIPASGHGYLDQQPREYSCERGGNIAYWHCRTCDKYYSDQELTNEITRDEINLPAEGHKWDEGEITRVPTTARYGVKTFTCTVCGETRTEQLDILDSNEVGYGLVALPDESEIRDIRIGDSIDVTELGDGQVHTFRFTQEDADMQLETILKFSTIDYTYENDCELAVFTDSGKVIRYLARGNQRYVIQPPAGTVYIQFDFRTCDFEKNYIPADTRVDLILEEQDYSYGPFDDSEEISLGETKSVSGAGKGEVFTYKIIPEESKQINLKAASSEESDDLHARIFRNGYEYYQICSYSPGDNLDLTLEAGVTYYVQLMRNAEGCTADTADITLTYDRYRRPPMAEIDPDCEEVELNKEYTVTADAMDKVYTYKFTPDHDGQYVYISSGSKDTYGAVCLIDELLKENDDGGTNRNFKITFDGTAGVTYYLQSDIIDYGAGEYTISLSEVHEHVMQEYPAVAATCQSDGHSAYWICDVCGKCYADAAGKKETTVEASYKPVDPSAHVWDEGTVTREPDFQNTGEKVYTCTLCGETKSEVLPKLIVKPIGLTFESVMPLVAVAGQRWVLGNSYYMSGNKMTLNYNDGTVRTYVCRTNGDYVGYMGVDGTTGELVADYTVPGGKFVLGENTITLYYTDINDVKVSTQVAVTGYSTEAEAFAQIHKHNMHHQAEIPATCTHQGYIEYWYCIECGKYFTDENGVNQITEAELETEMIPHTAGSPVRENESGATCSAEGGYDEVVYCRVCRTKMSSEHKTIEKLAHTPGETKELNRLEPTYTTPGSYEEVVYCSVCGEETSRETIVIPMLSVDDAIGNAETEAGRAGIEAQNADKASTASTNAADAEAAETHAQSAVEMAAEAEKGAQEVLDAAQKALSELPETATEEEVAIAQENLDTAAQNLATAKTIKAAANSALATAKKAAAKVAANKAASAQSKAESASTSAEAEAYRKQAEEAAAEAAAKAGEAEAAASAAQAAADELSALDSLPVSDETKQAIDDARDTAGKAAGDAKTTAGEADKSSKAAESSKAKAGAAVTSKKNSEAEAKAQAEAAAKAKAAEAARQGKLNTKLPKVTASKPKAAKKAITVKWKKLSKKNQKKAQKIEIWICPNKKFAASDTIIKTASKSKSSLKIKKLKAKKKYYIKVRTIKTIKGVKNVSKWSKVKSIKTK